MTKCPQCGAMMKTGGTCPDCGYTAGGGSGKGPFGQELDKMSKAPPAKKKSGKKPPAGPRKGG